MIDKNKLTLPILCIVIVLFTTLFYVKNKEKEDLEYQERLETAEKYNNTLKELRKQKDSLTTEIENLKKELVLSGKGSTIVLITDTNKEMVNSVCKILDEYNYIGVIAIDDYYDPGNQENTEYMDENDINNIIDKGYEIVLCVNNNSDILGLYDKYSNKGYKIKGFYYPNSDITSPHLDKIKQLDIDFVITYLDSINDDKVISIMSIGSYDKNAKKLYETSINESIISALSIGSIRENEVFIDSNVRSMLETIKTYEKADQTSLTNLEGAKNRYISYQKELEESINQEKLDKINKLESELKEIENKIIK